MAFGVKIKSGTPPHKMSVDEINMVHNMIYLAIRGELKPIEEDILKSAWKRFHELRQGHHPKLWAVTIKILKRVFRN